MNPLASQLNAVLQNSNPHVMEMLSDMGKNLYFPKGILSQGAEAKQKAHKINATIGIAKQGGAVMSLPSISTAVDRMDPDSFLPYAPSFGIPELRAAWKAAIAEKNPSLGGSLYSLPVVTSGVTHAVSTFADLWINPGDTVVLPDMMWGNYTLTFNVRNRAEIVYYNAYTPSLDRLDIESFETVVRAQAERTGKLITILNFPHNPTGYSPSKDEARQIADVLISIARKGTNVVVACDDAYFGLFYEDETFQESIFSLLAGKDPRLMAVKLDGATKEDYVWGLRVGFITYGCSARENLEGLYDALEKKTAGSIRGNISNASHLGQRLVFNSMNDSGYPAFKKEKYQILKLRAATIREQLASPEYKGAWDVYPFNSGYFMCIRLKDVDAEALRLHLLDKYGIGLISIGERNIRVAFSCLEKEEVKPLFDTILVAINELKKRDT